MAETLSPMLEVKKKLVSQIVEKLKNSRTVLIASTKNLPSSQFQEIKKSLRGKAEIIVAKKSIIIRAIKNSEKGAIQNLKEHIGADIALFFSNDDAFALSGTLSDNQSSTKAKGGDVAPEDITIEPGPTDLVPGPAISELSGVGLKVAVEGGKLSIKQGATLVKKGEVISSKVASVLGKLSIAPMRVGFTPLVAYDAISDKVYVGIKIDKAATLEELRILISKSLGFAINLSYICKETLSFILAKASAEERAIENLVNKKSDNQSDKEEAS